MADSESKIKMTRAESKAKSDFVAAVVIMIFSIAVGINSLGMPRDSGWSTAAGLVPLILSVSLFMMGCGLMVSSIRQDAIAKFAEQNGRDLLSRVFTDTSMRKTVCIIAITTGYIMILVDRVPFEVSGLIFLFVALQTCWKTGSLQRKLAISILVPVVLTAIFRLFFNIFLPGGTLLELVF